MLGKILVRAFVLACVFLLIIGIIPILLKNDDNTSPDNSPLLHHQDQHSSSTGSPIIVPVDEKFLHTHKSQIRDPIGRFIDELNSEDFLSPDFYDVNNLNSAQQGILQPSFIDSSPPYSPFNTPTDTSQSSFGQSGGQSSGGGGSGDIDSLQSQLVGGLVGSLGGSGNHGVSEGGGNGGGTTPEPPGMTVPEPSTYMILASTLILCLYRKNKFEIKGLKNSNPFI